MTSERDKAKRWRPWQFSLAHTKPKRRFLRFSLRSLLLVILVLCVVLGWKVERARRGPPNEWDGGVQCRPSGPVWLRKQLGREFFDDVVEVDLLWTQVSDLSPLAGLTSLKELRLEGIQ